MLKFHPHDLTKIIQNDPLVQEAKYIVVKTVSAVHKNSQEITLECENEKGNSFTICYAEVNGSVPDFDSILSYGQSGYMASEKEEIKFVKKEKTEREKFFEQYEAMENKATSGFENHATLEEILFFLNAEKGLNKLVDFNKMALEYIKISLKYGFEVESFRSFIFDFENKMKKFKPNRDYVFNEVFNKMTKGKK